MGAGWVEEDGLAFNAAYGVAGEELDGRHVEQREQVKQSRRGPSAAPKRTVREAGCYNPSP